MEPSFAAQPKAWHRMRQAKKPVRTPYSPCLRPKNRPGARTHPAHDRQNALKAVLTPRTTEKSFGRSYSWQVRPKKRPERRSQDGYERKTSSEVLLSASTGQSTFRKSDARRVRPKNRSDGRTQHEYKETTDWPVPAVRIPHVPHRSLGPTTVQFPDHDRSFLQRTTSEVWRRLLGAPPCNRVKGWSKDGHFDSGRVAGCPPPPCCALRFSCMSYCSLVIVSPSNSNTIFPDGLMIPIFSPNLTVAIPPSENGET